MAMTDPIADMLTRIRNANMVQKQSVDLPASRIKEEIATVLKEEGFIKDYQRIAEGPQGLLRLYLKFGKDGQKVISGLKRISKPGLRVYAKKDQIPKVLGGLGIAIISTSKGIMADRNARGANVGGEVICYVW